MENEILEPTPEAVPDMPGQSDPSPADSANDTPPANSVNTGLSELSGDPVNEEKDETLEEISSNDDLDTSVTEGEISGDEQEPGDDEEPGDDSSVTNVTVIHPPAQQIIYQLDDDATYHTIIDNDEVHPVPVLVMESLIEKDCGVMEKRLEDYTVTEAMLLLIWITLLLRMVFDYLGRRKS